MTLNTAIARAAGSKTWTFLRRHRRITIPAGALLALVLAWAVWIGIPVLAAQSHLDGVRTHADNAKRALLDGQAERARNEMKSAREDAADAHDWTHGFTWRTHEKLPVVGDAFAAIAQATDVVAGVADDVLPPIVDAGGFLPRSFSAQSRLDLASLADAEPLLERASISAERLRAKAHAIDGSTSIWLVNDAIADVQAQMDELSSTLKGAGIAAKLLPSMLGAHGPRNYFFAFQTPGEARGTGGLLGAFAILRAENGKVEQTHANANKELYGKFKPLDLGPEFDAHYGRFDPTESITNANTSPHFPYAARIFQSIYEQKSGMAVDGVVATDPVALSYILEATGPITLPDGEQIDSKNVVKTTMWDAYLRFGDERNDRREYLQEIQGEIVRKLSSGVSPQKLLKALSRAAGDGRLQVWSSHPQEQEQLERTGLAHVLPDSDAPYAQVVINNGAGSKLDYFLARDITYSGADCSQPRRQTQVRVRLTNTISSSEKLIDYVAGRNKPETRFAGPSGTNRDVVTLFPTKGARLTSITVDGAPGFAVGAAERGRQTETTVVVIKPGETKEIVFTLDEPTSAGQPQLPVQPLVKNATTQLTLPRCE